MIRVTALKLAVLMAAVPHPHVHKVRWHKDAASEYGPGNSGGKLACIPATTFTHSTLGVANRTLPCGRRVTFRSRWGRVTVPVVDRGPASWTHRRFDLTYAAARRLGFVYPWSGAVKWKFVPGGVR